MTMKTKLAGKAAKRTAKHSGKRAISKLRRDPVRTGTLLGLGCAAGFVAGWWVGRPAHQTAA